MAKTILELVRQRMQDLAGNGEAAEANGKLAARAIMRGRLSLPWREYMLQYVEKDPNDANEPLNPDQLARLLAADNTLGDPDMDRRRAYLLGNAVCGGGSPTGAALDNTVDTIDNGL